MPNAAPRTGSELGSDKQYTHWFVTAGRPVRGRAHSGRLVPLLLADKSVSLAEVKRRVEAVVRTRAMTFVSPGANYVEQIKAITSAYAVDKLRNLWLSEVRLAMPGAVIDAGEEAIEWISCFDRLGRMLPDWQGPADGVVPKASPLTIRAKHSRPCRFKIDLLI